MGYLKACKKSQSEIERLELELKKKDQIIEKAEKVIDEMILDIERCDRYFQSSSTRNQFQRKQENRKKQYFQDKDKE